MKKIVNIGVIGYGNVGSAVVKLVQKNSGIILKKTGIDLKIKAIADVAPDKKHPLIVRDANKIINDPEISIIVEAIGKEEAALKIIMAAFNAKKHVVTPNKELLSKHLSILQKAANKNGVSLLFEAAVGGGIPIIRVLSENLAANNITEIYGIVNGTTNYILSKMSQSNLSFEQALTQAKHKGFAEPNPSADIDGADALYKSVILASVAYGEEIDYSKVYAEGISKIKAEDIRFADEIGYVIKLLAIAKKLDNQIEVRVHPTLVPKNHALANVSDNFNAIYVKGDAVGELMFYGQGAGGNPTASAIVGDIIAIAEKGQVSLLPAEMPKAQLKDINEIESRYYVRLTAPDKHGVLSGISGAFAKEKVSIQAVMQKENIGNTATIVIIIHKVPEKNMNAALARIRKLSVVKEVCNCIRVGLD